MWIIFKKNRIAASLFLCKILQNHRRLYLIFVDFYVIWRIFHKNNFGEAATLIFFKNPPLFNVI